MKTKAVIGVGNSIRGDDALGVEIAESLLKDVRCAADVFVSDGNVTEMLDIFSRYDEVVIVDALDLKNKDAGSILRLEANDVPNVGLQSSSHSMGLAEVIKLATELDSAPKSLTIFGIVGRRFALGEAMSIEVRNALPEATKLVLNAVADNE